jgi:holin-like protein
LSAYQPHGAWFEAALHLIIPGNVLGLFILLSLLGCRLIPVEWVQGASKWLLFFLPLLFVPIYVAAAADKELWRQWGVLIVLTLVSAVAMMWLLVGHLAQRLFKSK